MAKSGIKPKTKLELKAEAIAACKDASGRIMPKAVWQAAKDESNILHGEFEWDLQVAAEQAWEARARELIREVQHIVIYEDRKIATPFYVSDPREKASGYIRTAVVAKNNALKQRALQIEVDRIRGGINRAMSLAMIFGLESTFEKMLSQLIEVEKTFADNETGKEARPE
jgi:hypothetical protein